MGSKIYADNFTHSDSDSSRGIAGRGVAMQATGRDLSDTDCHYCTVRTTAPSLRQSINRISDADVGSTSSEADINRISRNRGGSSSIEETGKCGAHNTRSLPTVTPIAAPGRQMDSTATPTLESFNDRGGRGYDDSVPGGVTKTAPSRYRIP